MTGSCLMSELSAMPPKKETLIEIPTVPATPGAMEVMQSLQTGSDSESGTPPDSPDSPPEQPHHIALQIVVLTGCGMAYQMSLGMCMPLYARYAEELNLGGAAGGLVLAAPCAARVLLNLKLGSLVDEWGRRPLLIGGSLVMAFGAYGVASATGLWGMLAGRLLVGAGGAAADIAAQACRLDVAARYPAQRGALLGWAHALSILAYAAGPVVGGVLESSHGVRSVFRIFAHTLFATALLYVFLPEGSRRASPDSTAPLLANEGRAGHRQRPGSGSASQTTGLCTRLCAWLCALLVPGGRGAGAVSELLSDPRQVGQMLLRFTLTAGWASWMIVLPAHLTHEYHLSTAAIGLRLSVMTLVGFSSSPVCGHLADRFGCDGVARSGAIFSAIALGMLPFSGGLAGVWAMLAVWELGTAAISAATNAAASEATRCELRGVQSSLLGQVQDGTFVLMPTALGFLAASIGTTATLGLTAVVQLAIIAAAPSLQLPHTARSDLVGGLSAKAV